MQVHASFEDGRGDAQLADILVCHDAGERVIWEIGWEGSFLRSVYRELPHCDGIG